MKNFHAGIPCLSGIVNSRLGHYPKEGEIYVFINGGHKQLKVYYLSPNQERVYLYHLSEGTYEFTRTARPRPTAILGITVIRANTMVFFITFQNSLEPASFT